MKNLQKGFVVPALIIIGVLVVGGGIYYFSFQNDRVNMSLSGEMSQESDYYQDNVATKPGWDIFIDEDNMYTFQYPQDLSPSKVGGKLFVKYPDLRQPGILMSIEVRNGNISPDDFIKEYRNLDEYNKILSQESHVFAGNTATKIVVDSALGLVTEYIITHKDSKTYIIHYYGGNESKLHHQEMLSTFRFL